MGKDTNSSVPTVLMIEDHDDTACLVRFILEQNGYAVRHAPDGNNAQRLMETIELPNLILLDISLPFLSGLEVLRTIRSTAEWQRIPVIVLTASSSLDVIDEANKLGAAEYLKKPFSPEHLVAKIGMHMTPPTVVADTRATSELLYY